MNYYSVNKCFTEGIVPQTKFGIKCKLKGNNKRSTFTAYHQPISDYYAELMRYDQNLTKIERLVCFNLFTNKHLKENLWSNCLQAASAPIQYKLLALPSSDSFTLRDLFIYSTIFGLILLIILTTCKCGRNKRPTNEQIPLKPKEFIWLQHFSKFSCDYRIIAIMR